MTDEGDIIGTAVDAVKACAQHTLCKAAVGLGAASIAGEAPIKKASEWMIEHVWGKRELKDLGERNVLDTASSIVNRCASIPACKAAVGLGATAVGGKLLADAAWQWLNDNVFIKIG